MCNTEAWEAFRLPLTLSVIFLQTSSCVKKRNHFKVNSNDNCYIRLPVWWNDWENLSLGIFALPHAAIASISQLPFVCNIELWEAFRLPSTLSGILIQTSNWVNKKQNNICWACFFVSNCTSRRMEIGLIMHLVFSLAPWYLVYLYVDVNCEKWQIHWCLLALNINLCI